MRSDLTKKTPCRVLFLPTPPWHLDHPRVNFDLHCFHMEDAAPEIFRNRFHELCNNYDGFIEYTLMVQRTVIEWPRLLLPETLLKQFGYQTKQTFSEPNCAHLLLLWISSVVAKILNLSSSQTLCQASKSSMVSKCNWIWYSESSKTIRILSVLAKQSNSAGFLAT